jgi:thioredoxin
MKKKLFIIILMSAIAFGSRAQVLEPAEFSGKIKTLPEATLLDVRTPEEFGKEHLPKAININWKEAGFENKVANYDKTKPVMVYCLSGVRSKQAADKLRSMGFTEVYELKGGIVKWNAEGLSGSSAGWTGISKQEYASLTTSSQLVLVDFFAEWCGPCKKMEPYLNQFKTDLSGKVSIVQIDADKNKSIVADQKVDALPVFKLYKNNEVVWQYSGYISRKDMLKQLKKWM